jgi:hypothetical protein
VWNGCSWSVCHVGAGARIVTILRSLEQYRDMEIRMALSGSVCIRGKIQ